ALFDGLSVFELDWRGDAIGGELAHGDGFGLEGMLLRFLAPTREVQVLDHRKQREDKSDRDDGARLEIPEVSSTTRSSRQRHRPLLVLERCPCSTAVSRT